MISFIERVADRVISRFVPHVEAKAAPASGKCCYDEDPTYDIRTGCMIIYTRCEDCTNGTLISKTVKARMCP